MPNDYTRTASLWSGIAKLWPMALSYYYRVLFGAWVNKLPFCLRFFLPPFCWEGKPFLAFFWVGIMTQCERELVLNRLVNINLYEWLCLAKLFVMPLWGIFDLFFKETDMGSTVLKENGEFFTRDELTAMKAAIHQHTFNHVPWPWHGHVGLDVRISRLSEVDLGPIAAIAVVASLTVVMKLSLSFISIGMSSGIDDSSFVLPYTRQV